MFPIRDNNPQLRFPFVNVALILLNVACSWFVFLQTMDPNAFILEFSLVPLRDLQTMSLAPFLTSTYLHGGILHLLANMWSLYIFGDNVEGRMGPVRYFLFYSLCGIAAGLTHALLNPGSSIPVVGASGAISGVMGAYLMLFPGAKLKMFTLLVFWPIFFELPAFVFLLFWFAGQLLSGTADLASAQGAADVGGVAFFAHIGGFVAGILLLPIFKTAKPKRRLAV